MASWNSEPDEQEPKHERKGVGYDYRRVWSSIDDTVYGLEVVDNSGYPASAQDAQDASSYAESLHGKPWGGSFSWHSKGYRSLLLL